MFNRWEAFVLITVTSSTKLKCFQQKYQEFKNNGISTPTSLIFLWCLKIRMAVSNVNIISESLLNPFAPGDFAEKRVLKLVEWFSGHCRAIKS